MIYRLKTIFNENNREVLDTKDGMYILQSLSDNKNLLVSKNFIINGKYNIINVTVAKNGRLYLRNNLENKVFSWWKYYGNSNIVGKQVISKILDEEQIGLDNLKRKGIDGLIIKNAPVGMKDIKILSEEYLVFYPNQIKSVYNRNPKSDNKIFEENEVKKVQSLSKEQINFFKRTAVREGRNIRTCYHSTRNKFTEFDLDFVGTGYGASYGTGFYFSSEPIFEYGDVIEVYLNIVNPYIIKDINNFYEVVRFLKSCGIK